MLQLVIRGANVLYVSDDPQVGKLYALHATQSDGRPITQVAWEPTPIELEALNFGAPVLITFLGRGLPPHRVEVAARLAEEL